VNTRKYSSVLLKLCTSSIVPIFGSSCNYDVLVMQNTRIHITEISIIFIFSFIIIRYALLNLLNRIELRCVRCMRDWLSYKNKLKRKLKASSLVIRKLDNIFNHSSNELYIYTGMKSVNLTNFILLGFNITADFICSFIHVSYWCFSVYLIIFFDDIL
jgi:hypothetical protein